MPLQQSAHIRPPQWRFVLKWIRNWLVVNICALVPILWTGLGWMPEQVKIQWRGDASGPVSIMADGMELQGEAYGSWDEGVVWRFYLREGMEWEGLVFCLPEGRGGADVGRIDLQKWKLLRLGKGGRGLEPAEGVDNGWRFGNPRFDSAGVASVGGGVALALLEMLLLGLSFLFARCHCEEKWGALWPSVVPVALVLAVLMQVVLPIQSYLGNESAYPFSFGALAGAVSMRFAWTFVLATIAIGLLARCFGRLVPGAVLAFAVCVYLEAGPLSEGLPSLNGDWWFFQNTKRALWDATAWAAVFALVLGLHPVLKKHYGLVALGLLVMVAASTLDVRREEQADTTKLVVDDFCSLETVVRNLTYSTNRNVMVFVIDSLEREPAHAIMEDPEAGPGLREKFRGFTEYFNNVGTGEGSLPAVANLFTGRYPEGGVFLADYYASIYSADSAMKDFLDTGHAVYVFPPALGYGYANPRADLAGADTKPVLDVRSPGGGQAWTLEEISRFRWLPFAAKLRYARLLELGLPQGKNLEREWNVYPILKDVPSFADNRPTFFFLHTDGVHYPVLYDRHGSLLAEKNDTPKGTVEMGVGILEALGELLDTYRARGIYDSSLILVLADHGNWGNEEHGGFPDRAKPFLWIKPVGSQHDFTTTFIPTSHCKISELLKESSRRILTEQEIGSILETDERLYRSVWGERVQDWVVDGEGHVHYSERHERRRPPSEMKPLPLGKYLSMALKQSKGNGDLDLYFTNVNYVHLTAFGMPEEPTTMSFRVPDARKKYVLRLLLRLIDSGEGNTSGASIQFRQDREGDEWKTWSADDWQLEVVLHDLVPDGNGMVTVMGRRGEGLNCYIYFSHLKLDEEG